MLTRDCMARALRICTITVFTKSSETRRALFPVLLDLAAGVVAGLVTVTGRACLLAGSTVLALILYDFTLWLMPAAVGSVLTGLALKSCAVGLLAGQLMIQPSLFLEMVGLVLVWGQYTTRTIWG